jgi:hypothetical protein
MRGNDTTGNCAYHQSNARTELDGDLALGTINEDLGNLEDILMLGAWCDGLVCLVDLQAGKQLDPTSQKLRLHGQRYHETYRLLELGAQLGECILDSRDDLGVVCGIVLDTDREIETMLFEYILCAV